MAPKKPNSSQVGKRKTASSKKRKLATSKASRNKKQKRTRTDDDPASSTSANAQPVSMVATSGTAEADLRSLLTEPGWRKELEAEFGKPYFAKLTIFLERERKLHPGNIFPAAEDTFAVFSVTPLHEVKVVILGQDPYFRAGQGHGLCFSVREGVKVPPSLNRIYLEMIDDPLLPYFKKKPKNGFLLPWAKQGVFLLNAILTVQEGKPNSHKNQGWEQFTTAVIQLLNDKLTDVVFMLWGGYAQKMGALIDRRRHHVLEAAHPSPMSGGAWQGNRHFSKCNTLLEKAGKEAINWSI
eukprot:gb/GEZN01012228.1/.p1 GENE.gb/GEZN01012228.1/~~gb/GEZN01012228.1/.p1  ORF type:complete len:296 (+),score=58.46 gb/GEZN01012228.1/:42-929(+)